MNEFTGKSKEELKKFKMNMESYKTGCLDTLKIIEDFIKDLSERTQNMWNEKIRLCEEEINKDKNEIKVYEFDGTPSGFLDMVKRKFGENSKGNNSFDPVKRIAYLQDGAIMNKGDFYEEGRKPEFFKCI